MATSAAVDVVAEDELLGAQHFLRARGRAARPCETCTQLPTLRRDALLAVVEARHRQRHRLLRKWSCIASVTRVQPDGGDARAARRRRGTTCCRDAPRPAAPRSGGNGADRDRRPAATTRINEQRREAHAAPSAGRLFVDRRAAGFFGAAGGATRGRPVQVAWRGGRRAPPAPRGARCHRLGGRCGGRRCAGLGTAGPGARFAGAGAARARSCSCRQPARASGDDDDLLFVGGAAGAGQHVCPAPPPRRAAIAALSFALSSTSSTNSWSSTHATSRIRKNAGISITSPTNWWAKPSDHCWPGEVVEVAPGRSRASRCRRSRSASPTSVMTHLLPQRPAATGTRRRRRRR